MGAVNINYIDISRDWKRESSYANIDLRNTMGESTQDTSQ